MNTPKVPIDLIKLSSFTPTALYARCASIIEEELKEGRLSPKEAESVREYQYHADNFLRPFVDHIRLAGIDHTGATNSYVTRLMAFLVFCGEMKAGAAMAKARAIKKKELDKESARIPRLAKQFNALARNGVLRKVIADEAKGQGLIPSTGPTFAKKVRPGVRARLEALVKDTSSELSEVVRSDFRKKLAGGTYPSTGLIRGMGKPSKAIS